MVFRLRRRRSHYNRDASQSVRSGRSRQADHGLLPLSGSAREADPPPRQARLPGALKMRGSTRREGLRLRSRGRCEEVLHAALRGDRLRDLRDRAPYRRVRIALHNGNTGVRSGPNIWIERNLTQEVDAQLVGRLPRTPVATDIGALAAARANEAGHV